MKITAGQLFFRMNRKKSFFAVLVFLLSMEICSYSFCAGFLPEEEFKNATVFFKKKDYAGALKALEKIEKESPDYLPADRAFMQGQNLRALRRWADAAQAFSRAAERHPLLNDYAVFHEGEARQMNGESAKSLEAFERLIRRQPESLLVPHAQLKIAELCLSAGDYARSAALGASLREHPKRDVAAPALILLGQAKEGLGQWAEAYKAYQEAWLRFPLDPLKAKAKDRLEFLTKEKKVPAEKIPPEALFRRALQYYQANLSEAALREMDKLEGFPAHRYPADYAGEHWVDELYFCRGVSLFRLKDYTKAADAFGLVARVSKNPDISEKAHLWMARSLFRLGRKDEALERCALLQKAYPTGALLDQTLSLKAKILEEKRDIPGAISVYREIPEKCPQSPLRFSSLWQVGWVLFNNRDAEGAVQAWDSLLQLNGNSLWMEKALYWKNKALLKLGKKEEAEKTGRQLCEHYPGSYYSQSMARRGESAAGNTVPVSLQEHPLSFYGEMKPRTARTIHLEKGKALVSLGMSAAAAEEMQAAEEKEQALEEVRLEISRIYRQAGEFHRSALVVRKNFRLKPLNADLPEGQKILYALAYPMGNSSLVHQYSRQRNLDPALLFGLILEESRYNSQVISVAGARGLMQLLPRTGKQISRRLGVPFTEDLLFDPDMNIRLGTWYFENLLREFGGKEALALAAYNAGPQTVRQWMAANPASLEDEFIENIPYGETRNYVVRVLTSAQIYRMLYGTPAPQK